MGMIAEDVDTALGLDLIAPELRAVFFLWRAIDLHLIDELLEKKELVERYGDVAGFNLWAEKYGLPERAFEPGHPKSSRRTDLVKKSEEVRQARRVTEKRHSFNVRPRGHDESAAEYRKYVRTKFARFEQKLYEVEKGRQAIRRKTDRPADIKEHAEWFVLYQSKGRSWREIAECGPEYGRGLTEGAIANGIKSFAELIGADLRPPGVGGRPKKTA